MAEVTVVKAELSPTGTYIVTLARGDEWATCPDIMDWADWMADDCLFDTFKELAVDGEEGFYYGIAPQSYAGEK